ncbi:maltokinase N-terminal cap-like domain-containing protein [Actinomadura alba]|uniref:maltokinase N-terminal cap-like domain-containing protein n=1 Tax=Actinomadura alba TaxID=406431 RepID=UPI0028B165FB|nr:phosphotransferase [Actinomadura alba]
MRSSDQPTGAPTPDNVVDLPGLTELLREWVPRQRWFAGKGREVREVTVLEATELTVGDPGLHHLVIGVGHDAEPGFPGPGTVDRYQLLLGTRAELPGRLEYAEIGRLGGRHIYDAVHDPELTRTLLTGMAGNADTGPLRLRTVPGQEIETDLVSLASPAEQSNSSLIFGDVYICKLFRRITPGTNPDLELNLGLTRVGCEHIPALHGWAETDLDGEPTTLAMLSEFLRTATDGWRLAATSVRDLYAEVDLHADEVGGDFASEAERLGAVTAAVHRDLARAFGVSRLPVDDVRTMAEDMHRRLDETVLAVPELEPYAAMIGAVFDDLAKHEVDLPVQRIHGDYHLGQVMRTERGWMLLDFEGEPLHTLAERRTPSHPLRDVAGMLRSFEYASRHLLAGQTQVAPEVGEQLEVRAREWAERNRAAFCRGYAEGGGPDPSAHEVLLRAFEYDKAVYEVLYEARNRPSWLHIPLSSFRHSVV